MENLMAEIMPSIVNIAITILTAVATYLGAVIKKYLDEKANTEMKRKVVETTCKYVEQIFKDLDGASKLEKAKENILFQLNEKNIPISDLELNVLIEATVNSFKNSVKE